LADATAARSDYNEALKSWRLIDELAMLATADGGSAILEETTKRVDRDVANAFDRARNAIAAQSSIVEASYQGVLGEVRSSGEKVDLKTVEGLISHRVLEEWETRRAEVLWPNGEVPENADAQHTGLFPSVKRKIELIARMILEEIKKESEVMETEKKDPKPEPDPEPEPEPEPEEPQDPEIEEEMIEISCKKVGDIIEITLKKNGSVIDERKVPAKLGGFKSAMKEVSHILGTQGLDLK
jgi:hypothetical protein